MAANERADAAVPEGVEGALGGRQARVGGA